MDQSDLDLGFGFDARASPQPSLGELADRALEQAPDEDGAVAELRQLMDAHGLRLPPTMGLGDQLRRVIRRYTARRVLEELPAGLVEATWLGLHVPRGASVSLEAEAGTETTRDLELQVLGSGGGASCTVTMSTKLESAGRARCVDFQLELEVRPVVYEIQGRRSLELNVLRLVGHRPRLRAPCPSCGAPVERLDGGRYDVLPYIDLSEDTVPLVISRTEAIAADASAKIGVDIAKLNVAAGVALRSRHETSLSLTYSLPPGNRYVPYRLHDVPAALMQTPSWTVAKGSTP